MKYANVFVVTYILCGNIVFLLLYIMILLFTIITVLEQV